MDTSDEDVKGAQLPAYPPHHGKRRNRASSQENISPSSNQSPAPESHTDPDAEEEELKRKLEELASNISDKEVSSEEEEREEERRAEKAGMSSSSNDVARDVRKV
ncbi:MELPH protein, partial [Tichodroma muraria]|nr:MELPH protein [Tichodroma muraria]